MELKEQKLNASQIESLAVDTVSMIVNTFTNLKSFIKDKDKTNTFDGSIFIFGDKDHTNASVRKAPVQVKGTTRGNICSNMISYPVEIMQMKNYSKNGGVMFFVVLVKGIQPYSIYYKMILPQDVEGILAAIPKTQKTKSLQFKLLDSNSLPAILNYFIDNMQLNCKIYDADTITKSKQFQIKAIVNKQDITQNLGVAQLEKIFNNDTMYLYAVPNPNEFPDNKLPIKKNIRNFQAWEVIELYDGLTIGEKAYQVKGTRIKRNNDSKVYIGANPKYWERSIVITENKESPQESRVDITIKGTLNQQIIDADFALSIFSNSLNEKAQSIRQALNYLNEQRKKLDDCGNFSDVIFDNKK